jgi:hypothetical protein
MLHFGKNPQGELELRATEDDVLTIYRTICQAGLQERRALYPVKALIEREFETIIKGGHGNGKGK